MIKRILVPLDSSDYTKVAIKYAILIAKKHNATITGMTILDISDIESSIGSIPLGGIYWAKKLEQSKIEEAMKNWEKIEDYFAIQCAENKIKYSLEENKGVPSEWILKKAQFHDLVIMGLKTYYELDSSDKGGDTIKKILSHSEIPVLLVPENYVKIKNVLIAFDGSMQATKAVHSFIHLAQVLHFNIKVINSTSDEKYAAFLRTNLQKYFDAYGINNVEFINTETDIIEIMDSQFYSKNDLFVIGAHSKNAIKEFFIGSLTRYLIDKNEKPIFLGL